MFAGLFSAFKKHVPMILQSEAPECGIACVAMIASHHGHETDLIAMRTRLSPSLKGITLKQVSQVAETMGLASRGVKADMPALAKLQLPAILHWDMNHFVVLTNVAAKHITVHDPGRGIRKLNFAEAGKHYTGVAMEFTPTPSFKKQDERNKIGAFQLLSVGSGLRGAIAQLVLLSFAIEIFAIAMPFFLQLTVDRVLVGRDRDFLTVLGVAFIALVFIQVTVTAIRAWVGVYVSTRFNLRLLTVLFNHLLRLPLGWFEKRNIGDIVGKFRSVDAIQKTLSTTFVETFIDGVMVLITLGVMAFYSLKLTLVVLAAAVLYALLRWFFYYPQRYATDEQLAHEAKASTHFIETLRGMMAIKLNMRENERRVAYQNLVVEHINANVKVQSVGIFQRLAQGLIFGVESVIVIWMAAILVMEGKFSVGMLYAFIGFKLLFLTRVNNLIEKWNEFRMLDLHAERIADIALAEPEAGMANIASVAPATDVSVHIQATDLGYAYGPEGFAFRHVNLEIKPGENICLVGPSGCGKTTLLKVLLGLLTPTEGQILVNGRNLKDWDMAHYRTLVAAVMQDDQLFVGSIADAIAFGDHFDMDEIKACAIAAQIHEDIEKMPMGYSTFVGALGSSLSGGQKQRVLLARALYRQPLLLILDETLDQVDIEQEGLIREAVEARVDTLVMVSHRESTLSRGKTPLVTVQLATN